MSDGSDVSPENVELCGQDLHVIKEHSVRPCSFPTDIKNSTSTNLAVFSKICLLDYTLFCLSFWCLFCPVSNGKSHHTTICKFSNKNWFLQLASLQDWKLAKKKKKQWPLQTTCYIYYLPELLVLIWWYRE